MIENDDCSYVVSCDGEDCHHSRAGFATLMDAVNAVKALGWKIIKGEVEWLHFCPDCVRRMAQKK